jgi:hypothetical protein
MTETSINYWDQQRGTIRSKKGGWIMGKKVLLHGHSLLEELVGNVSYFEVMILNAIGRMPDKKLAQWFEAAYMCLSWPDPRIWCNTVGALSGSARTSPVAAVTAGTLASDSIMYGPGVNDIVINFISSAVKIQKNGQSVKNIVEGCARRPGAKPIIPGFNRPIMSGDERIPAMERVTKSLGYTPGEHLSLAYKIDKYLFEKYDEGMNIAMYIGAFLLDQGFSTKEIYRAMAIMVNSGVIACYSEAYDNTPDSFLPLRCDDIEYTGPNPREVPER